MTPAENDKREPEVDPIAVAFHWSGGKDSALALGRLLNDARYEIRWLVTTVQADTHESSVHGLPVHVLRAQADAIGVPLYPVMLASAGLSDYVETVNVAARDLRENGIQAFAFGDLGQSDVLAIKEEQFHPLGIDVLAPLYDMTPDACVSHFLSSGIDAITVVVNAAVLDERHLGKALTADFIAALPDGCDPSGELGEYHTVVLNAPYFHHRVEISRGESQYVTRMINTTDGPHEFAYWRLRLH